MTTFETMLSAPPRRPLSGAVGDPAGPPARPGDGSATSSDIRASTRAGHSAEHRAVPVLPGDTGVLAHHVLHRRVLLECVGRHVLAITGGLDPTVRHLAHDRDVV